MSDYTTLYRPMGLKETELVLRSGCRSYPPRLEWQPIFYPVLNEEYAVQIARDWNLTDPQSDYCGFISRFKIDNDFLKSYKVEQVGGEGHLEYWIPAEELDSFNGQIEGYIELYKVFYGEKFAGSVPEQYALKGKGADEQFAALEEILSYNLTDFHGEVKAQWISVFINYPYWGERDCSYLGIEAKRKAELLEEIRGVWEKAHPELRLIGSN